MGGMPGAPGTGPAGAQQADPFAAGGNPFGMYGGM